MTFDDRAAVDMYLGFLRAEFRSTFTAERDDLYEPRRIGLD